MSDINNRQSLLFESYYSSEMRFENFFGHLNRVLCDRLEHFCTSKSDFMVYIHAEESIGKTHLLKSFYHHCIDLGHEVIYFKYDLMGLEHLQNLIELVDDHEARQENLYIIIDDLNNSASSKELNLLSLYERVKNVNSKYSGLVKLMFASNYPVALLDFELKDLQTRLATSIVYNLKSPDDDEKKIIVRSKARQFGVELNDEVLNYLFVHYSRDLKNLSSILMKMERSSLEAQRKITVPFLRELLA